MSFTAFANILHSGSGYLSTAFLLRLSATFLFLEVGWFLYCQFLHPFYDIPGPFLASFSRLWIAASVAGGKAELTQRELHKKYGPLVRIAPNEVSVADPEAIKTIYSVKSGFTKTDFYTPFAANISPHGDIFTQRDESKHAQRRKYVNSVYSMSTILESEAYIDACSDVFLEKMARFARETREIDFGEWIQWYTFDIVGELFFGRQFGFMRDEHDYGHYIESLDTLLPGIALSCVLPSYIRLLHSTIGLLLPTIRKSIIGFNEIRAASSYWTNVREEQIKAGSVGRVDLLNKFSRINEDKEIWDIRDVQDHACIAIFAGSDSNAIAIRSIFYYLMKDPACLNKLLVEIDDFDSRGLLSKPYIKYAEAIKMPYLTACCKEGMRLHPSVALGLPRHTPPGGAVIAGHFFPTSSRVSMNAAVIQYDQSIFGKDAPNFNPDRWIQGDAAMMDRHMLQFGTGSRTCVGKHISLVEIHKLIPTFLRRFRVELVRPNKEWETHNFWFNKQTGIQARITAR